MSNTPYPMNFPFFRNNSTVYLGAWLNLTFVTRGSSLPYHHRNYIMLLSIKLMRVLQLEVLNQLPNQLKGHASRKKIAHIPLISPRNLDSTSLSSGLIFILFSSLVRCIPSSSHTIGKHSSTSPTTCM